MQLYIGNKNYSSWSMRPWVLMTHAGIPFEEMKLRLELRRRLAVQEDDARASRPRGRVPLLVDDGFAVWDTLAIAEYLAERFPDKHAVAARRRGSAPARAACAPRCTPASARCAALSDEHRGALPEVGARMLRREARRARATWRASTRCGRERSRRSGGPFLFGGFSIADAYFAPVCSRCAPTALPVRRAATAGLRRPHAARCRRCRPGMRDGAGRARLPRSRTSRTASGALRARRGAALRPLHWPMKRYRRRRRGARRPARPAGRRSRLGRRRRRRRASCSRRAITPVGARLPGLPASADARGVRARAHRAQDRRPATAASRSTPTRRHARGGPAAPRPDDQRDGAGRGRRADRSATAAGATCAAKRAAPRLAGLRRRPGAHPARWRASRRASPTSASPPRPMALMRADGRGRRGRRAGARARLAGARRAA